MSSKRNRSPAFNNYSLQPIKFKKSQDGVRRELFRAGSRTSKEQETGNYSGITVASPKICMDFLNTLPHNIKDLHFPKTKPKNLTKSVDTSVNPDQLKLSTYTGITVASPKTCMDFLNTLPCDIKDLHFRKAKPKSIATPPSSQKQFKFQSLKRKCRETCVNPNQLKLCTTPHLKRNIYSKAKALQSPATSDFEKLEKLCYLNEASKESPSSSVCNLLESKMILHDPTERILDCESRKDILDEIKRLIKEDHEEYKEVENKIKELLAIMQEKHRDNYNKMCSLTEKLQGIENTNKVEEQNCSPMKRSVRLKNKTAQIGSPVILKAGDLRKSALRKSLCQMNQINSPRIQHALDLYNSTKDTCSALLTPHGLKGRSVVSPRNLNWRSALSLRIQEQCLMLQDTPKRK